MISALFEEMSAHMAQFDVRMKRLEETCQGSAIQEDRVQVDRTSQQLQQMQLMLDGLKQSSEHNTKAVMNEFVSLRDRMERQQTNTHCRKPELVEREKLPKDCTDVVSQGRRESGIYTIYISEQLLDVYCQMDPGSPGGDNAWTKTNGWICII